MEVYERFKRLTACDEEDVDLRECCLELEEYIEQIEYYCKKARFRIKEIMQSLEKEDTCDDISLPNEEPELPVEDYKLIREKFGEEAANRMYYDVKFGKVPLHFVQKYLSQIAN